MKRSKFFYATLITLLLALLCGVFVFAASAEDSGETTSKPVYDSATDSDGELKILCIGNSYSKDTVYYVPQILKDAGIESFELGHLYIANCSVLRHYANLIEDPTLYPEKGVQNYQYRLYSDSKWVQTDEYPIKDAITSDNWDYVVIQHMSKGILEPDLDEVEYYKKLVAEVKKYLPDATYVWNMTWANEQSKIKDMTQMEKYELITKNTATYYSADGEVSFFNPIGTAIQNARSSYLGDTLNRDGSHLSYSVGCYTAGLTFVGSITGCDITKVTWYPSEEGGNAYPITEAEYKIAVESAANALATPLAVTESIYESEADADPTVLYKVTKSDGTDESIREATDLNGILTAYPKAQAIKLYSPLNIDKVNDKNNNYVTSDLYIDLNGHTLTACNDAILRPSGADLTIYGGKIVHTSNNFLFMSSSSATATIEKCEISAAANFVHFRLGKVTIKNSEIKSDTVSALVQLNSAGSDAELVFDGVTVKDFAGILATVMRNADTNERKITIKDSEIATTTSILTFKDSTTSPVTENAKTFVEFLGSTKLTFNTFIGTEASDVGTTTFSFGPGVKVNKKPATASGTIEYINGALEFAENTGDDKDAYPYVTPKDSFLYEVILRDGTFVGVKEASDMSDLLALGDVKEIYCYANLALSAKHTISDDLTIDLGTFTLSNVADTYLRPSSKATITVLNGN